MGLRGCRGREARTLLALGRVGVRDWNRCGIDGIVHNLFHRFLIHNVPGESHYTGILSILLGIFAHLYWDTRPCVSVLIIRNASTVCTCTHSKHMQRSHCRARACLTILQLRLHFCHLRCNVCSWKVKECRQIPIDDDETKARMRRTQHSMQ